MLKKTSRLCFALVLCVNLIVGAVAVGVAPVKLSPPNLAWHVYQRVFPTITPTQVALDSYNLHAVRLSVYAVDISSIIPNTEALAQDSPVVPNRLAHMKLEQPLKQWNLKAKLFYPNAWRQQQVKLPALPSGVYVLRATGGGVDKRTWLAISTQALIVKRSPDGITAWLARTADGQPATGVPLDIYDDRGKTRTVTTGNDGLVTVPTTALLKPFWITARGKEPAFALAPLINPEPPYKFYLYTDRPLYRPGQTVHFRGTVRAVRRGVYSLPHTPAVRVKIHAREGAVVADITLPLDAFGSFSGDFQLAPEPPLGRYSLQVIIGNEDADGYSGYTEFDVQAYRKPDFSVKAAMPAEHILNGNSIPVVISADYFFNGPVAGGKVRYQVRFQADGARAPNEMFTAPGLGSAAVEQVEDNFSGKGELNAEGKLTLNIPTRRLPFDRRLIIQAQVTDLSLRTRTEEAWILITHAEFQLNFTMQNFQYQPGDQVPIPLLARDYDNKPVVTPVDVVMIEQLVNREGKPYQERTKRRVTTDKHGNAVATFTVLRPGEFQLEARARDADGNPVYTSTQFEVTEAKPAPRWPTLEMKPDKVEYAPGDTAHLHIRTTEAGNWALLTLEGERLYSAKIIRLGRKEFTVEVPVLPVYKPGIEARLTILHNNQMYNAYAPLRVPAREQQLQITLQPDKANYRPGETAHYIVTARDASGKPVAAEVGIGVVDTALYALSEDQTPDPYRVFWPPQSIRVETAFSLANIYPGGGYQHVSVTAAANVADKVSDIPVRKNFADTAYWVAALVTDKQGQAEISFPVPDNLTTWRATARGISKTTQGGEARNQITATLPLMARLVLPRFYIKDDLGVAAALIHNYTGAEQQVRVKLTADGGKVQGITEQTIRVPANGIQRVAWKLTVNGRHGNSERDSVRLLVSADSGAGVADAMESIVPVYPDGVRRVDAAAGMSADSATVKLALPVNAVPDSARVEVTISPSLAGPIFSALDYLVDYPYGCTEQTMDRFLPDVIVEKTLQSLGADRPTPPMLDRYVSFGLQQLLRYQHQDGGWQWWEFDQSDPMMTAYVVYGLAMARDAGYPLAAEPLPRGIDYLQHTIGTEATPAQSTYVLWALASANEWDDESLHAEFTLASSLIAQRAKLDTFSQASLALALHKLSGLPHAPTDFSPTARSIADNLERNAVVSGTASHWTANTAGGGSWLDSDVEVTAQVMQALLALKPDSGQLVPAVRWLMAARDGASWTSTKDTAAAVLALAAYLRQAKELAPDETVTVKVGERTVKTLALGRAQVFADPTTLTIPAEYLLPGENTVRLEKTGAGKLYWSARLRYLVPAEEVVPLAHGISLTRHYTVTAENPINAGVQSVGSYIGVTVTIHTEQNYRYAILEEPIPAGCEVIEGDDEHPAEPGDDEGGNTPWYLRHDTWDDRLVYYFDYLPQGDTTFSYTLNAETPGAYHIRPSTASLCYFPEVRGEGRTVNLKVREK